MIGRRAFLGGTVASTLSACVPLNTSVQGRIVSQLRIIEAAQGGTLGAAFVDTASGQVTSYNGNALFPHCSSFKLSLAALVLALDEAGEIDADEKVSWTRDDLMFVSPFTTKRVDEGATMRELAEFTQKYSDNAAANILLGKLGGPERLTQFWRDLGDTTSRLDRLEPALNNVPPGEVRDTTSARAMAGSLAKMLYSDAIPKSSTDTIKQWMVDTPTGRDRVRKGLPETWRAGDKTGTSIWPGMGSVYVDIGFVEPEGRTPITFAAYFRAREAHNGMDPASLAVLEEVGETLTRMVRSSV